MRKIHTPLFKKKIIFPNSIYIQTPYTTLDKIRDVIDTKTVGAYLRFGDGDVNLMEGKDDLLQKNNKTLSHEMREAFTLSGTGILKCLPLHSKKYGLLPFMRPGIHEGDTKWVNDILDRTYQFFIGNLIYSPIALSYVTTYAPDYALSFYRFIKKQHVVFVGNESVEQSVLQSLFGKETSHIKTPSFNAFDAIDEVENKLLTYLKEHPDQYTVVVVAMGCAGRVLEKRIIQREMNCFLFDFGSTLDIFCNKKTRAWMDLDKTIPDNYFKTFLTRI